MFESSSPKDERLVLFKNLRGIFVGDLLFMWKESLLLSVSLSLLVKITQLHAVTSLTTHEVPYIPIPTNTNGGGRKVNPAKNATNKIIFDKK